MSGRETTSAGEQRFLALAGFVVAIFSCVAGWLALRPDPSPIAGAPATAIVLPTNPPVVVLTQPPVQPPTQPPGPAPGGKPVISGVSPSAGRAGTQATLSASGFAPGEQVIVKFHTTELTRVTADGQGKLTNVAIKIPASWSFKGQFSIVAQGQSSLGWATWPFQVT